MIKISEILPPEHIFVGIDWQSKKRVFEQVSIVFENVGKGVARDKVFSALIARERLGATFIGDSGAIPHGRLAEVESPLCALVLLKNPIQYGIDDDGGGMAQTLFFLIAPNDTNETHLWLLGLFARMLSDNALIKRLRACGDSVKAGEILRQWEIACGDENNDSAAIQN